MANGTGERSEEPSWLEASPAAASPLLRGLGAVLVIVASAALAWLTLGYSISRPPLPAEVITDDLAADGAPRMFGVSWTRLLPLALAWGAGVASFLWTRGCRRWALAASIWAALFAVAWAAWFGAEPRLATLPVGPERSWTRGGFGVASGVVVAWLLGSLWVRRELVALAFGGVLIGLPAAGARRAVFADGVEALRFAADQRRLYDALRDASRVVVRVGAEVDPEWVRALYWPHAESGRIVLIVRESEPEFEQLRAVGFVGVDLVAQPESDAEGEALAPLQPAAFDAADRRLAEVLSTGPEDPRFDSLVFERMEAEVRGRRGPWLRITPSAGRFRVQFALPTGAVRWMAVNPDHGVFPVDAALFRWQALVEDLPPGTHQVWWRIAAVDRGLHTRWRSLALAVPAAVR